MDFNVLINFILATIIHLYSIISTTTKNERKVLRLNLKRLPTKPHHPFKKKRNRNRRYQQSHNLGRSFDDIDIYELCGIDEELFASIYLIFKTQVKHSSLLSSSQQLLLLLEFLRHYPSYYQLTRLYGVSKTEISRQINNNLPILMNILSKNFNKIQLPENYKVVFISKNNELVRVVGAVDCTSHYRNRVHPGQADYYRGDKHAHFVTDQVCSFFC